MEELFKLITTNIYTLIILLLSFGAFGLLLILMKKLPDLIINKFWKQLGKLFKPHKIEMVFNKYTKITDELNYLIEEFNADRGIILEFHNGDYYSSRQPQWKLSHSYGKSKLGVENSELNIKGLPASLVWDVVGPILNTAMTPPKGMLVLNNNKYCDTNCKRSTGIFFIEVEKINSTFSKYFLSRGSNYLIITSILDSNNNAVGLIILEFLDNEITQKIKSTSFTSCEICRVANIITSINEQ